MTRPRGGFSDLEVVPTVALADVLKRWIDEWRSERPSNGNVIGTSGWLDADEMVLSSLTWLSNNADVAHRVIHRILACETKTTSLYLADKLLTAIGRVDYLADGTVPVIPNPNLSTQSWHAAMRARGCDPDD